MKRLVSCTIIAAISFMLCLPCQAAQSCPESSAVDAAINQRNEDVKEVYDDTMPDPEADRSEFEDCLSGIMDLGDIFSMGVKIPHFDLCGKLNSMLQQKMREAMNKARRSADGFSQQMPFQVNGDPSASVGKLLNKIR